MHSAKSETIEAVLNKAKVTKTRIPFDDLAAYPVTLIDEEIYAKAVLNLDEEFKFILNINDEPFENL